MGEPNRNYQHRNNSGSAPARASNNSYNNRQNQPSNDGAPRASRNDRRMNQFNTEYDSQNNWYGSVEREDKYSQSKSKDKRPFNRQRNPKPKTEEPDFTAKKESTPKNNDLYNLAEYQGAIADTRLYVQNVDHASYGNLIVASHRDLCALDSRTSRIIPFPVYQHYCSTLLHAKLLMVADENGQNPLPGQVITDLVTARTVIPQAISDYLASISNTLTPQGFSLNVNYPEIILPLGTQPEVDSGTFGPCNAERHQVYETHFSPFVTHGFINACINANNDREYGDWDPLPAGLAPVSAQNVLQRPNRNLLSYYPTTQLHLEAVQVMTNLVGRAQEGNDLRGRLRYNGELMAYCSAHLQNAKIKLSNGIPESLPNDSISSFTHTTIPIDNGDQLTPCSGNIRSSVSTGGSSSARSGLYALKRLKSN